jgi:hypothetical protein
MIVELINYLFEKLSHGQRQLLTAALTTDSTSPSSPDVLQREISVVELSMISESLSLCSTDTHHDTQSSGQIPTVANSYPSY